MRLLEFIVDVTVKGERNSLKEWVIGTDVYDRGKDFDPRLDPIVRTEIRRLRRKLAEYFETEGREDTGRGAAAREHLPCTQIGTFGAEHLHHHRMF